jgi:hypothetical protein
MRAPTRFTRANRDACAVPPPADKRCPEAQLERRLGMLVWVDSSPDLRDRVLDALQLARSPGEKTTP